MKRYLGVDLHRTHRLAPIQGLNLRLLVQTQHQRPLRRMGIQAHNVPYLLDQPRIGGQLEGFAAVRLQPESLPDARNGPVAESAFVWTKTAEQILASVARFCQRTSVTGH